MQKEILIEMLRTMFKIRIFEEKAQKLHRKQEIPGSIHQYIGQEAVAVGACLNLKKEDYITSTHRGHGHCIAKGASLKKMMAELFGKRTGCNKGKGGSLHITDSSVGILGANGIVGGGIPIATGAAFASKYLENGKMVISFFGDGAADEGSFHESLNLASIWKLPIIYVCENNLVAMTITTKKHMNIENIADRAKSYNIPGIIVDGMDVIDVYQKINDVIQDVRNGKGPVLVEAKTYRYCGHWDGDPECYRTEEEVEEWRKKDPILQLEKNLIKNKIVNSLEIENIKKEVIAEVDEAIEFARKSPSPLAEEAMEDLYC